jgi:3-deoxy-D-manno-octulosonate 8-phosphate phosphatase (KDO 8-P phosphatase)
MPPTLSPTPPGHWTPDLSRRAQELKWLLLDVDGVLTDGRLWFDAAGEHLKVFDVRDGLAVKLLLAAGIEVGILSGRESRIVAKRGRDLGLSEVMQGHKQKLPAFQAFLARHGVSADQVAYIGDDLLDLPVLSACGLAAAPADAVGDVLQRVRYVTSAGGGRGAVRELAERILAARGVWDSIVTGFTSGAGEVDDAPGDADS